MPRRFFFPLIVVFVLVLVLAGLVFGLGSMAYNSGLATGLSVIARAPGTVEQAPYGYYGMPGWRPFGFGWFGPLGCLIPLFFLFMFFFLLRGPFWHGRRGWRGYGQPHEHQGPGSGAAGARPKGEWHGGMQAMFDEFHRRAHEQPNDQPGNEQTYTEASDEPVEE